MLVNKHPPAARVERFVGPHRELRDTFPTQKHHEGNEHNEDYPRADYPRLNLYECSRNIFARNWFVFAGWIVQEWRVSFCLRDHFDIPFLPIVFANNNFRYRDRKNDRNDPNKSGKHRSKKPEG